MYPSVKSVKANEDYTLTVEFTNGECGRLDMRKYLDFGVFTRLKDLNDFLRVKVAFDTVEWDVGVDLDPAFVYEKTQMDRVPRNAGQGA